MTALGGVRRASLLAVGILAGLLYALHLVAAIWTERALAVDGANFFLNLLNDAPAWPLFDDRKHIRLVANVLNQFPASLAIKAGIEDLPTLKLLFGAGLFLVPVCLSLGCVALCHRARDYRLIVFLVASLVTATLPSEQFKVNPAFTAAALSWVALANATLRLPITPWDQALVVVVLLALFRSHEGIVVWGPLLAVAAGWRILQCGERRPTKATWHLHAIALAGVALTAFVLHWQLTHPVAQQTQRFLGQADTLLPWEMWRNTGASRISLVAGVALLLILATIATPPLRRRLRRGPAIRNPLHWALWAIALGSAALALHVALRYILEPWHVGAYVEYEYRTLIVFGTAVWMGGAILTQRLPLTFARAEATVLTFALAAALAAASLWQLGNTKLWHDAQREVRQLVARSERTIIPASEVWRLFRRLGAPWLRQLHAAGWHWPTYSIAIQDTRAIDRIIMAFDERFAARPPRHPEHWILRMKWVTFFPTGHFDFDQFIANYENGPDKRRVETQQAVVAELKAIRALVGAGTVVADWDSDWFREHAWAVHRVIGKEALFTTQTLTGRDFFIGSKAHQRSLTPEHKLAFLYELDDLAQVRADELAAITATAPVAQAQFNIHWLDDGKRLAWVRSPCDAQDTAAPFLLHLIPVERADLPLDRRRHGFDNLDFTFRRAAGRMIGDHCWATVDLPDYPVAGVTTGQYVGREVIWKVSFRAE